MRDKRTPKDVCGEAYREANTRDSQTGSIPSLREIQSRRPGNSKVSLNLIISLVVFGIPHPYQRIISILNLAPILLENPHLQIKTNLIPRKDLLGTLNVSDTTRTKRREKT